MKKLVSGCIAVSMVLGMMAGSTAMAADDALDNIKERGKLIVATDAAWPPFEYMEGENVVGVDVDIAHKASKTVTAKEELIDFCTKHMASEAWPAEQVRAHMEAVVPGLNHWKK